MAQPSGRPSRAALQAVQAASRIMAQPLGRPGGRAWSCQDGVPLLVQEGGGSSPPAAAADGCTADELSILSQEQQMLVTSRLHQVSGRGEGKAGYVRVHVVCGVFGMRCAHPSCWLAARSCAPSCCTAHPSTPPPHPPPSQVLRPFLLRRLKESVASELPPKVGRHCGCRACHPPPPYLSSQPAHSLPIMLTHMIDDTNQTRLLAG